MDDNTTLERIVADLPAPGPARWRYCAELTPEQRVALVGVLTRAAWVRSGRTWPPPSMPRSQWPVRKLTRAEHDAGPGGWTLEEYLRNTPVE